MRAAPYGVKRQYNDRRLALMDSDRPLSGRNHNLEDEVWQVGDGGTEF